MHGGVHAQVRRGLEELAPERPLSYQWQAQGITIEREGTVDVGDEDGDTMQAGNHGRKLAPNRVCTIRLMASL